MKLLACPREFEKEGKKFAYTAFYLEKDGVKVLVKPVFKTDKKTLKLMAEKIEK